MPYSDEQKALGVVALAKWGARPAARWLQQEWGEDKLSHRTLANWAKAGVEGTDEAVELVTQIAQQRKEKWLTSFDSIRDDLFDAIQVAVNEGKGLVAQQLTTSAGIAFDKIVPPPKSGVPLIGTVGEMQMVVVAPAAVEAPEVIEAESREVE